MSGMIGKTETRTLKLDPAPWVQYPEGHNHRVVRRVPADYDWPRSGKARFAPRRGYSQNPEDYPPHVSHGRQTQTPEDHGTDTTETS